MTKTWDQIVKDFGTVDVLVTNAGLTGGSPAEEYDFNEWRKLIDVNLNGTFLFARAAGKHMKENKVKGSIIMVSSMSGWIVNRPQKQSAYNTVSCSRAAMLSHLRMPQASHKLRVGYPLTRRSPKPQLVT